MWTCDTELVSLPVQRIGGGYCRCVLGVRRLGHPPEKVRVNGFRKGVGSRFGNDSRTLSGDSPPDPFPASTAFRLRLLSDFPLSGFHNERVAARADGDGGVLARFAGDRLAQSLGGELRPEP